MKYLSHLQQKSEQKSYFYFDHQYFQFPRGESVASTATLCSTQTWVDNILPRGEEKVDKIRNFGTSEVEHHWTTGSENYENNLFNPVDVTTKPAISKRDSDIKNYMKLDHETLGSSKRWHRCKLSIAKVKFTNASDQEAGF